MINNIAIEENGNHDINKFLDMFMLKALATNDAGIRCQYYNMEITISVPGIVDENACHPSNGGKVIFFKLCKIIPKEILM